MNNNTMRIRNGCETALRKQPDNQILRDMLWLLDNSDALETQLSEKDREIERLTDVLAASRTARQQEVDALRNRISDSAAKDKLIVELREALAESVKLQSHYARLLNMWDGGERMPFASIDDWLARLTGD
jgi:hypothetical protein